MAAARSGVAAVTLSGAAATAAGSGAEAGTGSGIAGIGAGSAESVFIWQIAMLKGSWMISSFGEWTGAAVAVVSDLSTFSSLPINENKIQSNRSYRWKLFNYKTENTKYLERQVNGK